MRKIIFLLGILVSLTALNSVTNAANSFPFSTSYNNFSLSDTTLLNEKKFNIFVNQGFLNIKYNKPQELLNGEVIVYNLLGQEVTRKKLEAIQTNQVLIPVQNT
jgi:hypothetical protein